MGRNLVETLMGAVVLGVAIVFLVFAYSRAGLKTVDGYSLIGKFDRIDGLTEGSDVRMSGIKIGTVTKQALDPNTYLAVLTLDVRPEVKLPRDSSARIASDGLLGDKYLSITPGGEEDMLPAGGEIQYTQGSVDIVSLVGRMLFSQTGKKESKGGDKEPALPKMP
ncbi:MAG: phospholipid/cholesterol/gamma-HCH transport system substrate-binding protein [Alphaproteobacteria bacterium]|jgi:phospholipid/cholesterol/gamma-HCH transport system substrate-binding protein